VAQIVEDVIEILKQRAADAQAQRERDIIAEFLRQQLATLNLQENQQALLKDLNKTLVDVEAQLSAERASKRRLRLALRELAARWSRFGDDSGWAAAERQLTSILDSDL
jgi:hypothetical protein